MRYWEDEENYYAAQAKGVNQFNSIAVADRLYVNPLDEGEGWENVKTNRTTAHEVGHVSGLRYELEIPGRLMTQDDDGFKLTFNERIKVWMSRIWTSPSP